MPTNPQRQAGQAEPSESRSPYVLPQEPIVSATLAANVTECYERFATQGLPQPLELFLLEKFGLDVSAEYGGLKIRNPWGKASGQLSTTLSQVRSDVSAGLGFVVLKTVIAQDARGAQTMHEWARPETRMVVERIVGRSGEVGWTVTWKGRGWAGSFDEYTTFVREARMAAGETTLIVPSCKFHLPASREEPWNKEEYAFTTARLQEAWHSVQTTQWQKMPLEKDLSPTLAGSERAGQQELVLSWLQKIPAMIRQAAQDAAPTFPKPLIGVKLFNALWDEAFQLSMLKTLHTQTQPPDFLVYANRLFDPNREFEGQRGVAYGGPDLSDRNLRVLTAFDRLCRHPNTGFARLPLSATGNICSGKLALEYALRGASSFQLHTFFQLPATEYRMKQGTRTEKALHELYFHPKRGFVVWAHHIASRLGLLSKPIQFLQLVGKLAELTETR